MLKRKNVCSYVVYTQCEKDMITQLVGHLDEICQGFLNSFSTVIPPLGMTIGAVGAYFWVTGKIAPAIERNQPIEIFPLLRPIVMLLLIGSFYTTAVPLLNSFWKGLEAQAAKEYEKASKGYDDLMANFDKNLMNNLVDRGKKLFSNSEGMGEEEAQRELDARRAEAKGFDKTKWERFKEWAQEVGDDAVELGKTTLKYFSGVGSIILDGALSVLMGLIISLLLLLAQIICVVALFIVILIQRVELLVMAIFGPIVLGLSIFPPFKSAIYTWIGKYINVGLRSFIAYVIGTCVIYISKYYMDKFADPTGTGIEYLEGLLGILLILISTAAFFFVNTMANLIVQGGEGAITSGVKKIGEMATAVATKGASLKANAVKGAAKGLK